MNTRARDPYGLIIVNLTQNDKKQLMRQKGGWILKRIYKPDISHFSTFKGKGLHIGKDIWQRETLVIDIQIQDLFWQILFSTSKVLDFFDSSSEFLLMSITLLGQTLTNCSPPTNRDKLSGPTRKAQQTGFQKGRDISQGLGGTTSFQCCSFHHCLLVVFVFVSVSHFVFDLVECLHFHRVAHSNTGTVFVFEFVIVFVLKLVFELVECLHFRVAHFTTGTVPPTALQWLFNFCKVNWH